MAFQDQDVQGVPEGLTAESMPSGQGRLTAPAPTQKVRGVPSGLTEEPHTPYAHTEAGGLSLAAAAKPPKPPTVNMETSTLGKGYGLLNPETKTTPPAMPTQEEIDYMSEHPEVKWVNASKNVQAGMYPKAEVANPRFGETQHFPMDLHLGRHTWEGAKTGAMVAGAPLLLEATVPQLIGGLVGGEVGSRGGKAIGEYGAKKLGASKETQNTAGEVGGEVGNLAGMTLGGAPDAFSRGSEIGGIIEHPIDSIPEGVKSRVKGLITSEESKPLFGGKRVGEDLVGREIQSHIPVIGRGVSKPSFREGAAALTYEDVPQIETARGQNLTKDKQGNIVYKPGWVKQEGDVLWMDKTGKLAEPPASAPPKPTRRVGDKPNLPFKVIGGKIVEQPAEPLMPAKITKPSPWATDADRAAQAAQPAQPTVDTTGKGFSKSGGSPGAKTQATTVQEPAQTAGLGRIGQATPAELIPEAPKAAPEAKLIPEREPGLSDDYHTPVRDQVFNLSDAKLKDLAKAHDIDPTEDKYAFGKGVKRTEGNEAGHGARVQTGRQALADAITNAIPDAEKVNIGRNAERLDENPNIASKSRAERAESLFPRLRGPVDEAGNPKVASGLEDMAPRELHQGLGFGESNTVVTKEDFEAAKKSFNDKATRSNGGVDPTMLADASKIAAYYIEGGLRSFSEFSTKMVEQLGEAVRPLLPKMYGEIRARVEAGVPRTWKGTPREWAEAREGAGNKFELLTNLPEAMGGRPSGLQEQKWLAGGKAPEFAGETTPSKLERYTDPNGQFYKTVLKALRKTTTSEVAPDIAQDVMADFVRSVKEGTFKLPENTSEEGRVTDNLKAIAHNKAVDWNDKASGLTASGAPRNLLETKRLSETATPKNGSTGPKLGERLGDDEEVSNLPEESKSPYGFGEERPSESHSNAQRALNEYLKEHPETAAEDKELLLSASKLSLEKAEAARSKAYEKELAKYGDKPTDEQVEKAIESGLKAEALINRNKYNATDRYFGLTDADMTKLGQSQHLSGPKLRARLAEIMDDVNGRARKGSERPQTGYPTTTTDGYSNFLSGEGPSRTGFGRITTEKAPTVAKPTETYGKSEADPDAFQGYLLNMGYIKPPVEVPEVIPPLEHAPSRIGGIDEAVIRGSKERPLIGAMEPKGSRALTGPRVSHSEAWSMPTPKGRWDTSGTIGAGQTLPLTEPLPVGKPPIETEPTSGRGGRTGITPIDLGGAAENRARLANLRVAEAEEALSKADTPAKQRTAREALEDAKDRLNLIRNTPVSGGSQGKPGGTPKTELTPINLDSTAFTNKVKQLGHGEGLGKISEVVKGTEPIISEAGRQAQQYLDEITRNGAEEPTEVEHESRAEEPLTKTAGENTRQAKPNMYGIRELNPADAAMPRTLKNSAEIAKESNRILARMEKVSNLLARSPDEMKFKAVTDAVADLRKAVDAVKYWEGSDRPEEATAKSDLAKAHRQLQRVSPPSVSGGAPTSLDTERAQQLRDLASEYLSKVENEGIGKGVKVQPRTEQPQGTVHGVGRIASGYVDELAKRGTKAPLISHVGEGAMPGIETYGGPAFSNDAAAASFLSKITPKEAPSKVESDINSLASARQRLGLTNAKPSRQAMGTTSAKSLMESSKPQPVLRERANTKFSYTEDKGELLTKHRVEATDATGKPTGYVEAQSENDNPGTWTVRSSRYKSEGTGLGTDAYAKMADKAAKAGVKLQGDATISDSALQAWARLKRQGYDVRYSETGRPYIPAPAKSSALPKPMGGEEPTETNPGLLPWLKRK